MHYIHIVIIVYNEGTFILLMLTCAPDYSLLVYGWPWDTGTRKIHELILVLSSSLTPSPCPLSLHMILLTDGGWLILVVVFWSFFFQHYWFRYSFAKSFIKTCKLCIACSNLYDSNIYNFFIFSHDSLIFFRTLWI